MEKKFKQKKWKKKKDRKRIKEEMKRMIMA